MISGLYPSTSRLATYIVEIKTETPDSENYVLITYDHGPYSETSRSYYSGKSMRARGIPIILNDFVDSVDQLDEELRILHISSPGGTFTRWRSGHEGEVASPADATDPSIREAEISRLIHGGMTITSHFPIGTSMCGS